MSITRNAAPRSRRIPFLVTWLSCLVAGAALWATQAPQRTGDEAGVRELVRRYVAAREARDPRAIEALFTADADQRTTSGEWRRGRAAIVPGAIKASQNNPGSRTITVEAVRFLTPDVAVADGPYLITSGNAPGDRGMWATLIAVRTADGWRIAAIRNMVPTGGN